MTNINSQNNHQFKIIWSYRTNSAESLLGFHSMGMKLLYD